VAATGCVHSHNTAPCDDGNACTTDDTCSGGGCTGGTAAVLTTDPALHAYMRLEEATGTRVDSSPQGNDLSPVNNPGQSTDRQEGDFSLDLVEASSQYLERASGSLAAGFPGNTGGADTGLTIAGWVKMKNAGNHPLVLKTDGTQRSYSVWIWDFGAGPVVDPNIFNAAGQGNSQRGVGDFGGTTVLLVGQWYHVVSTYDGTTGLSRVYVNGALDAGPFDENMTTYYTGTAPFRLGRRPGFGSEHEYADVLLDEVLLFDRVLSDAEVASLFQDGIQPPSVACDDGDMCTGTETCNPTTGCQAGTPLDCDDSDVCTDDACVPATGCVHTDNIAPCDDDNACTTNDTCSGGNCAGGAPPDCDDSDVCTDDSCVPATGCAHTHNTAACEDGNPCTTNDTCSDGVCGGGPPPNCDDDNVCTDDSCEAGSGCVNTPNADSCDDGQICTSDDVCIDGVCEGTPDPSICTDHFMCYKAKITKGTEKFERILELPLSDRRDVRSCHPPRGVSHQAGQGSAEARQPARHRGGGSVRHTHGGHDRS
jgi:hypothetical protein